MRQEAAATGRLPVFDAPAGGRLSREMLEAYRSNGVILLRDFVDPAACRALPAEAPAGTLAIFDGRAPHRSGPNRSDRPRHAYTLHVIDQRCRYPATNWLQRGPELPLRGFVD